MIAAWLGTFALSAGLLAGILAQATPGDPTTSLVAAVGAASPFAALAMYVIVSQKADLKQEREEKNQLIKDMMERVIPGQLESNRLHQEVVKALEAATVQTHAMAGRAFDPQIASEILSNLKRLRGPR